MMKTYQVKMAGKTLCSVLLLCLLVPFSSARDRNGNLPAGLSESNVGGYLISRTEKMDSVYGGGYSMYVNVYPLQQVYTGRAFQSGLFGTWMFPFNDPKPSKKMYTDIE